MAACLIFTINTTNTFAQGKLKKADKLFEAFSFPEAAKLYKQIAESKGTPSAVINLAECYRLMNMPEEAEAWYAKVIELDEAQDIHLLRYGLVLKINDKCDEAREYFLEYAERVPADTRGIRQVEACDKEDYFKQDPGTYEVREINQNSSYSDFGPAFFEDGILFSSARGMRFEEKVYNWTNTPYLDLYTAESDDEEEPWDLKKPKLFKGKTNSWLHEGTVTFTGDGETMFFTRNNYIKGKKGKDSENTIRLKIYTVEKSGDKWGDIKELPFNSDDYSVGHPTLSSDGESLYFVSDMPGGEGNEDIYVSQKEGDSWGEPQNLGPEINTEGREMFPFIHEDGVLYFSSDALPGLGGLDVFQTRKVDGGWIKPENLRTPINSYFDDFGFILNEEGIKGYFASNRTEGDGGDDDIYAFTRASHTLKGIVVDCNTGEPLIGSEVELFVNGEKTQEQTTYSGGGFAFPVNANQSFSVKASRLNHIENEISVSAKDILNKNFMLEIPICPEAPVVDNGNGTGDGSGTDDANGGVDSDTNGGVNYSIKCEVSGKVFEKDSGSPIAGAEVVLRNRITNFETRTFTDADGLFSFEVDRDVDYKIEARKDKYFKKEESFTTKGLDCSDPLQKDIPLNFYITKIDVNPINPTLIPDDVLALNHIYYDLDKDFIRNDAAIELDKVVKLMYDNPGIILELGSHTDSRASDAYNMDLSQRRAQSAVDYIVSKGIASDRISAVGYGETQLLNECSNGVKCSETKHQENRRTEFKVVGYRANAVYSAPRYFGTGDYYYDSSTSSYNNEVTYSSGTSSSSSSSFNSGSTFFDEPASTSSSSGFTTYSDDTFTSSSSSYVSSGAQEFKIQLGAFRKMPSLTNYENELGDLGYSISTEYVNGTNKIVMGTFYDRFTAEEILQRVKQRTYPDAFIVIYENGTRK